MTVTQPSDGVLTVTFTADEFAGFQAAVAAGVIAGATTAAGALETFLQGALVSMTAGTKAFLRDRVRGQLDALTLAQLQAVAAALPGPS